MGRQTQMDAEGHERAGERGAAPARAFLRARWALGIVVLVLHGVPGFAAFFHKESRPLWVFSFFVAWGALAMAQSRFSGPWFASDRVDRRWLGLFTDVVFLTSVLAVSGAAENPLTLLYFVPVALSTLLHQRHTWLIVFSALIGFALLLLVTSQSLGEHAHHGHFFRHIMGMALSLAVAGGLVTYFSHEVAQALRVEEARVERLEKKVEQGRVATQLGALAASLAHELGTPLGTIHLISAELSQLSPAELADASSTVLREVRRMRAILDQMIGVEPLVFGRADLRPWGFAEIQQELSLDEDKIEVVAIGTEVSTQPLKVVAGMVRELLRNAEFALPPSGGKIQLRMELSPDGLRFVVRDDGAGMSKEILDRACEPFFSTRQSRGLGLFLASLQAAKLGGALHLESQLGSGTTATLRLPLLRPDLGEGDNHHA